MGMDGAGVREDVPSRKKLFYPIGEPLRKYLRQWDREIRLPLHYADLLHFSFSVPLLDKNNQDTLWQTVQYEQSELNELYPALKYIYALLHADGRMEVMEHLSVARIDYCTFGNSKPFRIRIINRLNDNYDHFYIKYADASRVFGLELEHILSPNRINYLTDRETLIEEHIPGLPGDVFIEQYLHVSKFDETRISKEFVKFNERCFVRLLGDMRSYNFVVDITPDIEGSQYRIRSIDFDQQSYEGRKSMYLPQFFKENRNLVFLCMQHLNEKTILQYQQEERSLIAHRVRLGRYRLDALFDAMNGACIAPAEKIRLLGTQLADHHEDDSFQKVETMPMIVQKHLYGCLNRLV